jgi:hypothetical protein
VGMRRIAELVAIMIIGEGVLTLIASRRHSLLWEFGPEGYRSVRRAPDSDQARGWVGHLASLESVFAGGVSAGTGAWHGLRSRRVLKEGVRMALENPALNERSFQRGIEALKTPGDGTNTQERHGDHRHRIISTPVGRSSIRPHGRAGETRF